MYRPHTRETYLAKLASGYFRYKRIDAPVDVISSFDDTAIIAGRMFADVEVGDAERNLSNAYLAVYRRRDDVWRLVGYQPTPLKGG
ncbi:nuclear transport factor 2 family protein [Brucella tritici]|uniref:Nuclear transport factor 2 family protein n=1 Tax=Brucella tritici TaxID=94626 RepID=A0A833CGA0_9HYPH|nr:nuclear transport factor 2 family protein [Brucella tritici]KAB2661379.1 nuclear transport factor 2 family protein [Brucella tritici]